MSLFDHLDELRARLIKAFVAVAIGTLIGWFLAPWPLAWMSLPLERTQAELTARKSADHIDIEVADDGTLKLRDRNQLLRLEHKTPIAFHLTDQAEPILWMPNQPPSMLYLRPMDPFVIQMKAALVIGLILSMPIILLQIWGFIGPGLLPSERQLALPMVVAGTILFPVGAAFAYWLLDVTLGFFAGFVMGDAGMVNDASAYLGFALTMMLAFGVVFELPLAIILATRIGLVSVEWLGARRKHIFVGLLVVAAVATPSGDPFSMLAMGLPLYLLFEIALVVSWMLDRRKAEAEAVSRDSKPAQDE